MFDNYNEKDLIITEYKFVFEPDNNGWWLKIDSVEKLIDYHRKTEKFYSNVLTDYLHNKEYHWQNKRTLPIVMYAQNHNLTILDAIIQFRLMISQQQLERIHENGAIYINSSGGYHSISDYTHFVVKDKLIFPDYKTNDIKIEQFIGGTHWYAYIKGVQVKDGSVSKWNTYKEAYEYIQKFIGKDTNESGIDKHCR